MSALKGLCGFSPGFLREKPDIVPQASRLSTSILTKIVPQKAQQLVSGFLHESIVPSYNFCAVAEREIYRTINHPGAYRVISNIQQCPIKVHRRLNNLAPIAIMPKMTGQSKSAIIGHSEHAKHPSHYYRQKKTIARGDQKMNMIVHD